MQEGRFILRYDCRTPNDSLVETTKETDNHRLVIADDKGISLLWGGCIRGHIIGLYLFLEGNFYTDITLVFINRGWGISLPE